MAAVIDLSGARNKLRQAETLYAVLSAVPAEIERPLARASPDSDVRLMLETYFFACLNAARSVFFILNKTGGPDFKEVASEWRNETLTQAQRTRFSKMLHLRDRDICYGDVESLALPKMIDGPDSGSVDAHYHAALFGPRPMTELENPDGTKVSARALRGSMGLYFEIDHRKVEGTTACAEFIGLLRLLLGAAARAMHDSAGTGEGVGDVGPRAER